MPIIVPARSPLSNTWTHRMLVSEALIVTGNTSGEKIQIANVRQHINVGLAHIAETLSVENQPWFGEVWTGTFEGLKKKNLFTLNLGPAGTQIDRIKKISLSTPTPYSSPNGEVAWTGNCTKRDISVVTSLARGKNTQYSQSVVYAQFGNELFFAIGQDIVNPIDVSIGNYIINEANIDLWVYRKPILDDIQSETNYETAFIDMPDRYIPELLAYTERMILKQTHKVAGHIHANEVEKLTNSVREKLQQEVSLRDRERQIDKLSEPASSVGAQA